MSSRAWAPCDNIVTGGRCVLAPPRRKKRGGSGLGPVDTHRAPLPRGGRLRGGNSPPKKFEVVGNVSHRFRRPYSRLACGERSRGRAAGPRSNLLVLSTR